MRHSSFVDEPSGVPSSNQARQYHSPSQALSSTLPRRRPASMVYLSAAAAWLAAISYSLQLYFDFSGYSNMAIGLGWLSGFYFPMNFNYPYISLSITEFWRRWHISLSRWFRDYLYIPLGGNRDGPLHTYRNLIVVFLLCGFWHGAAWTFRSVRISGLAFK